MAKSLFTRGLHDTWNGIVGSLGLCNFSVIGTYGARIGEVPRIVINYSEVAPPTNHLAINWDTGSVIKELPNLC